MIILRYVINVELAKISERLEANKLVLNISKTKYMFFHMSNRTIKCINLKINTTDYKHVFGLNFLGVTFNSHMNWNTHINYIASKISRIVGILYRLKDILRLSYVQDTRHKIQDSLFQA